MTNDYNPAITEYARSLFDAIGVSQLSNGDSLLILGLESTPDRNLDEFGHLDDKFQMYGFAKHIDPRLESLLDFIRGKGFSAEPIGRYGYPLEGEIDLKSEVIHAGLCKRGKSTLALHSKYGPRLRFIAIRIDTPLEPITDSTLAGEENPVCDGCSICIEVCPTKALEPCHMVDPLLCLSNVTQMTEDGRSILCDKCLHLCPAAKEKQMT